MRTYNIYIQLHNFKCDHNCDNVEHMRGDNDCVIYWTRRERENCNGVHWWGIWENVIKAVHNGPEWAGNRPKKGVSLSLGPRTGLRVICVFVCMVFQNFIQLQREKYK